MYALFPGGGSRREGARGAIGVARLERSRTQRQKPGQEDGDDKEGPLAAFHGSAPELKKS